MAEASFPAAFREPWPGCVIGTPASAVVGTATAAPFNRGKRPFFCCFSKFSNYNPGIASEDRSGGGPPPFAGTGFRTFTFGRDRVRCMGVGNRAGTGENRARKPHQAVRNVCDAQLIQL